jgi:vacuolar-type H+-ATPase subunit C/Vma6
VIALLYGTAAAQKYSYSNARVRAMSSVLVKRGMLLQMLSAKEPSTIASMLLQTRYKPYIEEFGGAAGAEKIVDFALNKSLGRETSKLVFTAPLDQKGLIRAIVGIWDVGNIKLLISAKSEGRSFDDISRYVIDSAYIGYQEMRGAMAEQGVEAALSHISSSNPQYRDIIGAAANSYKKGETALEVNNKIDMAYYSGLAKALFQIAQADDRAASLIRKDIDMRNIMFLIKAKKSGAAVKVIAEHMLPNGSADPERLQEIFSSAKDVESLAAAITEFDMNGAIEAYRKSTNKPLILFEMAMRKSIMADSMRLLGHTVMSFGAIVAFFYLKEIEVFNIRILINGKAYSLSEDEIKGMMV